MSIQNGTTLTKEGIEYLCGLIRDISGLDTKLIDDINLKTNGSWSSVHTKNMIDQSLTDSKAYVDKLIGALNKLSSKKTTVQPTLDNSEFNVIYLYSSSGSAPFDQYLKIGTNDSDAELVSLGSTNIDLTDYLKITDADSTYCKKTDFDTLKTVLTSHTSDTDIHITSAERTKWNTSIINDVTSSTDKVYSSNKVDELIANISNKIDALKPLRSMIPIMTSNTTPSGEVLYSSFVNDDAYPYHAFDYTDKYWASSTSKNSYIGYDFKKYVCIRRISFLVRCENTIEGRIKNFRFEALDSNNVWTTLFIGVANNDVTNIQEFDIPNYNYYKKYRLFIIDGYEGTIYNGLDHFNMFGYEQ